MECVPPRESETTSLEERQRKQRWAHAAALRKQRCAHAAALQDAIKKTLEHAKRASTDAQDQKSLQAMQGTEGTRVQQQVQRMHGVDCTPANVKRKNAAAKPQDPLINISEN